MPPIHGLSIILTTIAALVTIEHVSPTPRTDWSGCGQPSTWTVADYRDCQAWQREKRDAK